MTLSNENIILNIYLVQKCSRHCFRSWECNSEEKSDVVPTFTEPSGKKTSIKYINTKLQTVTHGIGMRYKEYKCGISWKALLRG